MGSFGRGDVVGIRTMRYAQAALHASAGFFCWLSPAGDVLDHEIDGLAQSGWEDYLTRYAPFDPLNIATSVAQRRIIGLFSDEKIRSARISDIYDRFRSVHSIKDELSFVFWLNDIPFASLSVIKLANDSPFNRNMINWPDMQAYFEFTLGSHPRVKKVRVRQLLRTRFLLTARELEVAELLCIGASNAAIGSLLNIGIATVKTHVIKVLEKLGVESRSAVAAYCGSM